jgi:MoaA/NifB/PqqE/SkfB family radical SAM enzyme
MMETFEDTLQLGSSSGHSELRTLLVETNQSCNLNCGYCFYRDYGRSRSELAVEDIDAILQDNEGVDTVYLTGGETTLAHDFYSIVARIHGLGIKVGVFTNGLSFDRYTDDQMQDIYGMIGKLFVSFDCFSPDYRYRQRQDRTLSAIKRLIDLDPEKLVVKIGLNKRTIGSFSDTMGMLEAMGVKHLSVNLIHNINASGDDFELSSEDVGQAFAAIDSKAHLFDAGYVSSLRQFFIGNEQAGLECPAGIGFGFVDSSGVLMPCPADYQQENCLSKECICLWEMF